MSTQKKNLLCFLVSACFFFSVLFYAGAQDRSIASVNGSTILNQNFEKFYQETKSLLGARAPSKKKLLQQWINRELAFQEAKKQHLDQDPLFQQQYRTLLMQRLLQKETQKQIRKLYVSTHDAYLYYKKHPEIRTRHIFISAPLGISKKKEQQALLKIKRIQKMFQKGKQSFAELAQKYSEGPSAPMGGDIDFRFENELFPNYYKTALQLKKPGKVSHIIRTPLGYHFIQLSAIRSWPHTDQARIKRILLENKQKKLYKKVFKNLRKKAKIQIHQNLLQD